MWHTKKPNGSYQYFERYTDPLTGKKRVTSVTLKSNTNSARKQAEMLLFSRIRALTEINEDYTEITLQELTDKYIAWKYRNLKEQTAISSEAKLNRIIDILGRDTRVSALTARYVIEKLTDDSPTKYNERIRHIKSMVRWGFQNDYLENDHLADKLRPRNVVQPRTRNAQKYLEHDEIKILLDAFIPKYRLLTEFMILSGVRIGEALDLKKKDVDLKKREIYVHTTFSTVSGKSSSTKTKASERVIFIQDELLKCIKDIRKMYHSKDPYLFEFGDLRSAYFSYNKYFKENTEKLLGRKLTPHCLRHTHTSLMAENGVPLSQISRRLGHGPNSKVTEQVYLHVTNKMIKTENDRIRKLTLIG